MAQQFKKYDPKLEYHPGDYGLPSAEMAESKHGDYVLWEDVAPYIKEDSQTSNNRPSAPLNCSECSASIYGHHNYCWNCGTKFEK